MAYQRKTIDCFEFHVNYGQGWEHETTEFHPEDIRDKQKEYRENCPQYPTKVGKTRIFKKDLSVSELNNIEQSIREAIQRCLNKINAAIERAQKLREKFAED